MSRSFTLAVERVADDRRFAERFRTDPHGALRRYRLGPDEVRAVQDGDPLSLARHGLDVDAFQRGERHGWRPHWRKVLVGLSVVGAVAGLAGAPAVAARNDCGLKDCTGKPLLVGLRRADGRALVRGRAIRLGRMLVTRTSLRAALERAGARAGVRADGLRAVRARFDDFCKQYCQGEFGDGDPVVLAGD